MILEKRKKYFEISNDYMYIVLTLLISTVIFTIAIIFQSEIYIIFNASNYLTWHILLEISSVVFAFIIFNSCYHSYKHTKRLRLLILAVTFFIVGCLDFLHALTFDGMPNTVAQSSREITVLYWILSRLIMAIGIYLSSITQCLKKIKTNEKSILIVSNSVIFVLLYIITYKATIIPPLFIEGVGLTRFEMNLEYFVMFLQIIAIINYLKRYKSTSNKYLIILCSGLVLMVFSEALFMLYKSMLDTFNVLGHIYKTVGYYLIYYSIFKHNIDMPYTKLKDAQGKIELYANNLEKIVDIKTKEFRDANEMLNKELDYAKVIQQSLLPPNKMKMENVVFRAQYIPCEKLSGDFYDIFEIDKENIGMYILDVTGHGVPAALLTMFSINNIKSNERLIKRYRGLKPHRNLEHFYEQFNKLNFPEEMHIVTLFATYNIKSKVLTYCSAGMNCYPIVSRKSGEIEFLDKSKGFPICQFSDFYTPEYESAKLQLHRGDKVIFYTDGLVDMQKNSRLSEEELINILKENKDTNIEELNRKISRRLVNSQKDYDDDITYFIMEVV